MSDSSLVDQSNFRRILARNISLPLALGSFSAALFVALIFYLLSVLNWVEHSDRVISSANNAQKLSIDLETGLRGFGLTRDENFLEPYKQGKPMLLAEMANLKKLVSDNPLQVERVERIQDLQEQWEIFAQHMITQRVQHEVSEHMPWSTQGKVIMDKVRGEFSDFLALEHNLRNQRTAEATQTTYWTVGLYLLITLIISGVLALVGRRQLVKLAGNYDQALQQQIEQTAILEKQAWLKNGQSQLAELMIGHDTLQNLGIQVLKFIALYVDVAVAAIYQREADGTLRRIASYGFDRESEQRAQHFSPAEGLIGQAAQENRQILLRDVPADYLKVVSGLGSTTPRNVVVMPFPNEGIVIGVLELGFMRDVGQRDLDLLELISDNLGASFATALFRQRQRDLLVDIQQLNEGLYTQQEELRASNEELEEQAAALEESQMELENQSHEMQQTNARLNEQAHALQEKNTALNAAQVEIAQRADDLQRASRYKSEFLANMSHELRTPLNSSLILAKLLADNPRGNLTAEQVRYAHSISSAGNDLLTLINDILDISKVEAGKLELRPEQISLRDLTDALKLTFQPLAQEKDLPLTVNIETAGATAAPEFIVSDRLRVEQILKNLLSNAIKFTEAGSVTLTVARDAESNISFSVEDTGIGIPPDQHEIIFDAFTQADGTASRNYGGTGLGLSISCDLAKLLGGSIHVESKVNEGSTFQLILPQQLDADTMQNASIARASSSAAPPYSTRPLWAKPGLANFADDRHNTSPYGRTALVIEDEPAFAAILYELAHELQFRCLVAFSAEEGLQLATEFLPQAILLDIGLPDRSGLTLLQQLKENAATRHIPLHIVSAADPTDAALQLGAIGYAVKPVTRDELKKVFRKLEEQFTRKIKRVLLVEDDALQRETVTELLAAEDIEIVAVELGEQALQQLRSTVFDCMIIDLKLPDFDGDELLRRMATEDIRSFPPVIVYTGRSLTRDEEAELMKHSRSIIIKGARSPERLLDEVTLFLHKVESELSPRAQSKLKTVRNREHVFENRKILLVDDDVRNIFALTSALEQKGLTVEVGRNGIEAISKLNEVPDIDLVLMDVMMPGMDGLEAMRIIRRDLRFVKLPIIAITAKAMKDDQQECIAAGATDYLAKPLDLNRLFSLLQVWLPHVERHAQ